MTAALEGGEWSAVRPGRTLPLGKTLHPFYRRLGGSQGRSGQVPKISSPPGIFFLNYKLINPSLHKYDGCMEDISVMYC